jgi:hypothetical protein
MRMKETYVGIRHPIAVDSGLGRLASERSFEKHVEQMMLQVLLTNPGERLNRPDFGCGLRRMVFAPNSDVAASLVKVSVHQGLGTWLGTVLDVEDVQVTPVAETLTVRIIYTLKAREGRRYLDVEVTP